MTDKLDKAKWIAYQELNDDDIMDAIQGSVAIPLAIKYNDWDFAFQLIKQRIDNKMQRRAEFYVYSKSQTPSIDDDDELRSVRTMWLKNEYKGNKDET
jgi:hypothetical protein